MVLLQSKKPVGVVWIALIAVLLLTQASAQVTFDSLLDEMINRDHIAMNPSAAKNFSLRQTSTHDTRESTLGRPSTFTNRDFVEGADFQNKPLYGSGVSSTERVFMNANGPGALTRMWIGGNPQHATYRFYVDGNANPVLSGVGSQLIGNNAATFGNQLSFERGDEFFDGMNVRPGGMNLYAPIPYSQNLTITVDSGNPNSVAGQWFVANHRKYDPGVQVQSYTAATPGSSVKLSPTNTALANRTGHIGHVNNTHVASQTLQTGQSMSHSIQGEGAFRRMQLKVDPGAGGDVGNALRETYIELTFDGQNTARVPVGHFFGNGYNGGNLNDDPNRNINSFDDWWRSVEADGTMDARWPMPFASSGEVKIVNESGQDVKVDLQVASGEWNWNDSSMHFHSNFREETDIQTRGRGRPGTNRLGPDTDATADWRYLTVRGKGVYVGDTLSIENPRLSNPNPTDGRDSIWWGEGDEKIYIDYIDGQGEGHSAKPNHAGTGTEDYYGYAWAARGEYDSPFIAQPLADGNSNFSGQTVNSRVRMLDTIPFDSSFKFDMEIWHGSDRSVNSMDYATAAFWYGRPGAVALETAADLTWDFRAGVQNGAAANGIADTAGDGQWAYLSSDNANPNSTGAATSTLTWGDVGNAGNDGYGGGQNGSANLTAISDQFLFLDGDDNIGVLGQGIPGYHELALHPGGDVASGPFAGNAAEPYVVARWMAGESSAGLININGSVRNLISNGDSVDFYIYVNGLLAFQKDASGATLPETYFDFDAMIQNGQFVDFVLGNHGGGNLSGDESLLRAIILSQDVDVLAVPQPGTLALLGVGGLMLLRRRAR